MISREESESRFSAVESPISEDDLLSRIQTLRELLQAGGKQREYLLNTIDGQVMMSVILGLKPLMGLTRHTPRRILEGIIAQTPNLRYADDHCYDPFSILGKMQEFPEIFADFSGATPENLNDNIRNVLYDPERPEPLFDAILQIIGREYKNPGFDQRIGLLYGFPKSAVDYYCDYKNRNSAEDEGYNKYGFHFVYRKGDQTVIAFDQNLQTVYDRVEAELPDLKTRAEEPRLNL